MFLCFKYNLIWGSCFKVSQMYYPCMFGWCVFSVEYCNNPGPIENGQMEGIGLFTCISTVKYTCNEGYWLLGAETLRCGINGQWNHRKPSCIDKSKKQIMVQIKEIKAVNKNNLVSANLKVHCLGSLGSHSKNISCIPH